MSNIFLNADQLSPPLAGEDRAIQARGFRDGSQISVDWLTALVAQGVVHTAGAGSGTTPDTFNPVYGDALQDFYLYVPAGTVIIPLQISISFEDTSTAAVMDVLAGYSSNGDSAVTGTALTIYNYRTLASPASVCTATAVVTAAGTTHLGGTDFAEFWRPYAGFGEDAFNGSTAPTGGGQYSVAGAHWSARQFVAPMIGSALTACALSIFAGATAGTGFIQVVWAELSSDFLS
jgi:hypothetical protein